MKLERASCRWWACKSSGHVTCADWGRSLTEAAWFAIVDRSEELGEWIAVAMHLLSLSRWAVCRSMHAWLRYWSRSILLMHMCHCRRTTSCSVVTTYNLLNFLLWPYSIQQYRREHHNGWAVAGHSNSWVCFRSATFCMSIACLMPRYSYAESARSGIL